MGACSTTVPTTQYDGPSLEEINQQMQIIQGQIKVAVPGIASALLLHGDFTKSQENALQNIKSTCSVMSENLQRVRDDLARARTFISSHPQEASKVIRVPRKPDPEN
jgi:hypothetical protein